MQLNLGALFFRYLDRDKVQALAEENSNYDAEMLLSEFSRNEIIWWKKNVRIKNVKWIRDPKVDVYLETDASKDGWGAHLNGKNYLWQMVWNRISSTYKCFRNYGY